jgi:CheY-like chemotaxis protein
MSQRLIVHIDDDDDDCQLLKEAIEASNAYVLKQYSNGQEGLQYLEQVKVCGIIPSLIILDINMPVMDGREVVKRIKQDEVLKTVSTIVFTTSGGISDYEFCKTYKVPMLVKPFTVKEFDGIVQQILQLA